MPAEDNTNIYSCFFFVFESGCGDSDQDDSFSLVAHLSFKSSQFTPTCREPREASLHSRVEGTSGLFGQKN